MIKGFGNVKQHMVWFCCLLTGLQDWAQGLCLLYGPESRLWLADGWHWFGKLGHDRNLWWALHRTAAVFFKGALHRMGKKEELFYSLSPLFIDTSLLVLVIAIKAGHYPLACFNMFTSCVMRCSVQLTLVMWNLCSWYWRVVLTVLFYVVDFTLFFSLQTFNWFCCACSGSGHKLVTIHWFWDWIWTIKSPIGLPQFPLK